MNKKYLKSLLSFILTIGLTVPAVALGNSTAVFGAESGSDSEESVTISFENGIHSVANSADGNRKMVVYCMNNQMLWPHDTDSLGDVSVPKYLNGYLKASDFDSEEKYEECMDRLESVLYAGYPYNGGIHVRNRGRLEGLHSDGRAVRCDAGAFCGCTKGIPGTEGAHFHTGLAERQEWSELQSAGEV